MSDHYAITNAGETILLTRQNAWKLVQLDEQIPMVKVEECCGSFCSEAGCCPFGVTNES